MTRKTILIVEDEELNREILRDLLGVQGYRTIEAVDGATGLEMARRERPDLILLDVMMPGMSGFEVCRRLKSDYATQLIPVVLVTALTDKASKLEGVEAGADDFINKPVDLTEFQARVRSLLHTKALHDELQQRYRDLAQAEKMREGLMHMVVHDLRSPLTTLLGYFELLDQQGHIAAGHEARGMVEEVKHSGQVLEDMLNDILTFSRLEAGEMRLNYDVVELEPLLSKMETDIGGQIADKQLMLLKEMPQEPVMVKADPRILHRVLANIVGNAVKFSPVGGEIIVAAEQDTETVSLSVRDKGPGIPAEFHGKIFEKFGQVNLQETSRTFSFGLGLAFCKMAVEAHGGTIGVESELGTGSAFWFTMDRVY